MGNPRLALITALLISLAGSLGQAQEKDKDTEKDKGTLPEVGVTAPRIPEPTPVGPRPPITSFGDPVGSYGAPALISQTAGRPFATTRAYVIPEGQVEFEQWYNPEWPRRGKLATQYQEELQVGLGCRFQLDLYEVWNVKPDEEQRRRAEHEGVMAEVRYALADWNVIPFNPTLYLEWVNRSHGQPDKYEIKLLLAQNLTKKAFYAVNLNFEQEVAKDREQELVFAQGLGYEVIDKKLTAGIETRLQSSTVQGSRGSPLVQFHVGPSITWVPSERTFLQVAPLFGTTKDSTLANVFIIFGVNIGKATGDSEGIRGAASARGR